MAELAQAVQQELPWWASAAAAVLLSLAAAVARRVARRSARPQGERLGELERRQDLERTRRLQLEAVLAGYGVDLPYWPPDGPNQRRPAPAPRHRDDDEDQADELEPADLRTRESPSIPPLPEYPQHRR